MNKYVFVYHGGKSLETKEEGTAMTQQCPQIDTVGSIKLLELCKLTGNLPRKIL